MDTTALFDREVQANVSAEQPSQSGSKQPADLGQPVFCCHAVWSESIGAAERLSHEIVRNGYRWSGP